MAIPVTRDVAIGEDEVELTAIRSRGPGGQNVNKVATAVQLRFDIPASSLPAAWKARLLALRDRRIGADGVLTLKAQTERSQQRNREQAVERLVAIINSVATQPKRRIATRPGRAVRKRRLDAKRKRGRLKSLRRPVSDD